MEIHEKLPIQLDTKTKTLTILETSESGERSRVTADLQLIETNEFNESTGAKIYEVKGRVFVYDREKIQ
jgi:hypothetical protein